MSKIVSGDTLVWQRWEFSHIDQLGTAAEELVEVPDDEREAQGGDSGEPAVAEVDDGVLAEPVEDEVVCVYPTAAELEAIHQEAYQAGFDAGQAEGLQAGREAGHAEAYAAARDQFEAEIAAIASLRERLEQGVAALEAEVAPELLDLAVACARRIVADHVAVEPDAVLPSLRDALAELGRDLGQARVRVHPRDLAVVQAFLQREGGDTRWQFIEDSSVEPGGCLIDSAAFGLDLSLVQRWQLLRESLGVEHGEA